MTKSPKKSPAARTHGRAEGKIKAPPLSPSELWTAITTGVIAKERRARDRSAVYRLWFRTAMPYHLARLHQRAGHTYLMVNRDYKPLGMATREWVDYEKHVVLHPEQAITFGRDPLEFTGVWTPCSFTGAAELYLYGDDPRSRDDYWTRLELLTRRHASIASLLMGVPS